ncbi:hypothetical protein ACPUER_34560 [Burkholderia sp. DN3021]|uniref:hypothetical protein n=1 Tax=Burkholderia sp. DN3021 TaxID=3410137 RepID=UPI003C7D7A40
MTSAAPEAPQFQRLHYPLEVILQCVRWYVAYPLSLRHLEEMMAERGVSVDHSTVHRWAIKLLPVLEKAFLQRKRPVGKSWRMMGFKDFHCARILLGGIELMHVIAKGKMKGDRKNQTSA